MDSGCDCTHANGRRSGRNQEPQDRPYLVASGIRSRDRRRISRFLLPRSRSNAAAGRSKAGSLQHHVWSSHLRSTAVCRLRVCRNAGQPVAQRRQMSDLKSANPLLPIDPATHKPIPPRAQPGYYPGFSTLGQKNFWDEATRELVLQRVNEAPPIRFFRPEEADLLKAVCDRISPQDDRDETHKIPIVNGIDQRLHENRTDGYRYESMPADGEAHRLGLQGIETVAQQMYERRFLDLGPLEQDTVLKTLHDGKPPAGQNIWQQMPVHRYWMLLVQDVVEVYYAHPW